MKLSKKASEKYIGMANISTCPIAYDLAINVYDIDVNGEYIIWGYSDENICHISKLRYKEDSYIFRVGHVYYNINDFYNIYGI